MRRIGVVAAALAALSLVATGCGPAGDGTPQPQRNAAAAEAIPALAITSIGTPVVDDPVKGSIYTVALTTTTGRPGSTQGRWATPRPLVVTLGTGNVAVSGDGSSVAFPGVAPLTFEQLVAASDGKRPVHVPGVALVTLELAGAGGENPEALDPIRAVFQERAARVLEGTQLRLNLKDPQKIIDQVDTLIRDLSREIQPSAADLITIAKAAAGHVTRWGVHLPLGVTVSVLMPVQRSVINTFEFLGITSRDLGMDSNWIRHERIPVGTDRQGQQFSFDVNLDAGFIAEGATGQACWEAPQRVFLGKPVWSHTVTLCGSYRKGAGA